MPIREYVELEIENKLEVPVDQNNRWPDLDGSTSLKFDCLRAYNLKYNLDMQVEDMDDDNYVKFENDVVQWITSLTGVKKVHTYYPISSTVYVDVQGGYIRSDGSTYQLDVVKFSPRKTDPKVWDKFVSGVVNNDPDHFVSGTGSYVLYVQDMSSPQYSESSMDFARRVFKQQYGGYMADVKHLNTTVPKFVMDWFKSKASS